MHWILGNGQPRPEEPHSGDRDDMRRTMGPLEEPSRTRTHADVEESFARLARLVHQVGTASHSSPIPPTEAPAPARLSPAEYLVAAVRATASSYMLATAALAAAAGWMTELFARCLLEAEGLLWWLMLAVTVVSACLMLVSVAMVAAGVRVVMGYLVALRRWSAAPVGERGPRPSRPDLWAEVSGDE